MESGLEGRNNGPKELVMLDRDESGLNGVRPRRPEQYDHQQDLARILAAVSMESGLEGRNNPTAAPSTAMTPASLNGVRPRRPEQ